MSGWHNVWVAQCRVAQCLVAICRVSFCQVGACCRTSLLPQGQEALQEAELGEPGHAGHQQLPGDGIDVVAVKGEVEVVEAIQKHWNAKRLRSIQNGTESTQRYDPIGKNEI